MYSAIQHFGASVWHPSPNPSTIQKIHAAEVRRRQLARARAMKAARRNEYANRQQAARDREAERMRRRRIIFNPTTAAEREMRRQYYRKIRMQQVMPKPKLSYTGKQSIQRMFANFPKYLET